MEKSTIRNITYLPCTRNFRVPEIWDFIIGFASKDGNFHHYIYKSENGFRLMYLTDSTEFLAVEIFHGLEDCMFHLFREYPNLKEIENEHN